jgi:hypothetical protein
MIENQLRPCPTHKLSNFSTGGMAWPACVPINVAEAGSRNSTLVRSNVDCLVVKSALLIHIDLVETRRVFLRRLTFDTNSPKRHSRASAVVAHEVAEEHGRHSRTRQSGPSAFGLRFSKAPVMPLRLLLVR